MSIGEDLRNLREEAGVSISTLARNAGIGADTITKIETEKVTPFPHTIHRLNNALKRLMEKDFTKLIEDDFSDLIKSPASIKHKERLKRWKFEPEAVYRVDKQMLIFLRKEGIHHIFKSSVKGVKWVTAYTDAQLVDIVVETLKVIE